MESETTLKPQGVLCFPSEPIIPEGPGYEKNINTISMYREKFYQPVFGVSDKVRLKPVSSATETR